MLLITHLCVTRHAFQVWDAGTSMMNGDGMIFLTVTVTICCITSYILYFSSPHLCSAREFAPSRRNERRRLCVSENGMSVAKTERALVCRLLRRWAVAHSRVCHHLSHGGSLVVNSAVSTTRCRTCQARERDALTSIPERGHDRWCRLSGRVVEYMNETT